MIHESQKTKCYQAVVNARANNLGETPELAVSCISFLWRLWQITKEWFKTAEMWSLTVLEVSSPKSVLLGQHHIDSKTVVLGENSCLALQASGILGFVAAPLIPAHGSYCLFLLLLGKKKKKIPSAFHLKGSLWLHLELTQIISVSKSFRFNHIRRNPFKACYGWPGKRIELSRQGEQSVNPEGPRSNHWSDWTRGNRGKTEWGRSCPESPGHLDQKCPFYVGSAGHQK